MKKPFKNPFVILLIVLLASVLILRLPFSVRRLQTVRPGYFHFWNFKGYTTEEYVEGPAYTIDETNFPVTSHIDEIIEEVKYAIISKVTKELVDRFAEKGYKVTVNSIYPIVHIEQRRETQQFRDYSKITIYSTLTIDCEVQFETDKPVAESPFPAWALAILSMIIDKLPAIIVAALVGLGLYVAVTNWASTYTTTESTIEIEYYDEEGNLIKRERRQERGPSWQSLIWMIVATIVIAIVGYFIVIRFIPAFRRKG